MLTIVVGVMAFVDGVLTIVGAFQRRRIADTPGFPSSENGLPRWTFISGAIFTIGLLILVPSGLCTSLVLPFSLRQSSMLGMVLAIGGISVAIGAMLVYAGLASRRQN